MQLYLVRHGESTENKANAHNKGDSILTELGHDQAKLVAKKLSTLLHINGFYSSTLPRAKQTAEHIAEYIAKEPEYLNELVEIRRPTELVGKSYDDPFVKQVKRLMWDHAEDAHYHFSDEENFFEFTLRCKKALQYFLEKHISDETVVAVTHGYTMRMMVAMANMESFIKPNFVENMRYFWSVHNTGITRLDYVHGNWHLITWNNIDHLTTHTEGISI